MRTDWLAAGVLGAGLGAAAFVGAGVAAASPDDSTAGREKSVSATQSRSQQGATSQAKPAVRSRTVERESGAKSRRTTAVRAKAAVRVRDDTRSSDGAQVRPGRTLRLTEPERPVRRLAETAATPRDSKPATTAVSAAESTIKTAALDRELPAASTAEKPSRQADRVTVPERRVEATQAAPAPGADTLVNGKVTAGTVIVDLLRAVGLGVPGEAVRLMPIPLPNFVETWWFGVRRTIYGPPSSGPVPTQPAEPRLIWESNFDSLEETQQSWDVQTGRWGQTSGEKQYYTPGTSNAFVDGNGNLILEVRRETPPDGLDAPYDYTSARVVTYQKQSVEPPVRVTARIKLPYEQGILPAFWTVGLEPGHEFDWPRQGEIDIVELPGMAPDYLRRHWTGTVHGPADFDNTVDVKLENTEVDLGVDLSADFHEYGIDWYPDRIIWHVDGVQVGSVTQAEYEALGGDWTPFSGAWPHYLILTAAVGNDWTGDPDETTPDQVQMQVDWVKVWALGD